MAGGELLSIVNTLEVLSGVRQRHRVVFVNACRQLTLAMACSRRSAAWDCCSAAC
ncbi:hypothetical protein LNO89_04485 [Klebsiella pneumoniae subsp. pneumoniae]|nr:hypothetical protein [Klebsiella pneumoniae subsp. pneumoniae]